MGVLSGSPAGGDRPAACTPLFSCGRFEASPAAPKRPSASTVQPVCSTRKGTQCHTSGHWPPELSQRAFVKCRQHLGKDRSTWGAFSAAAAMAASRRGLHSVPHGFTKMLVAVLASFLGGDSRLKFVFQ